LNSKEFNGFRLSGAVARFCGEMQENARFAGLAHPIT
jgi:hypothetical protein